MLTHITLSVSGVILIVVMETVQGTQAAVAVSAAAPAVPNIIYTLQYPVHVSGVNTGTGQVTVNTVNVRKVSPASMSSGVSVSQWQG